MVEGYYSARVREHGGTPRGVDWNSTESQLLRFEQLLSLVDSPAPFSIIDYGCGYGALAEHLIARDDDFTYQGVDLSGEMLSIARLRHAEDARLKFVDREEQLRSADFVVASGIFNVRLGFSIEEWEPYVMATIERIAGLARRGFAFNVLTSYSDVEKRRPDLYYADPLVLFDHCKRRYARNVALLHDYGLYEFTIRVRF